jgi:hypothetical protein
MHNIWGQVDSELEKDGVLITAPRVANYLMARFVWWVHKRERDLSDKLRQRAFELLFPRPSPFFWIKANVVPEQIWIAQYRGINYNPVYFPSTKDVEYDAFTSRLNRMAPAAATYSMLSLNPRQIAFARESEVLKCAELLQKTLQELKTRESETHKSQFLEMVQKAAAKYNDFCDAVKHRNTNWGRDLSDMKALGYPTWASSDLPFHALKYCFGKGAKYQKPVYDMGAVEIDAVDDPLAFKMFDDEGRPRFPFFGKIFIALLRPEDHKIQNSVHVMELARCEEITLSKYETAERETGIPGGVHVGFLWYERAIEAPDFSQEWDASFEARFLLNKADWTRYRKNPNLLKESDAYQHKWAIKLLSETLDEVQRRRGELQYWQPGGSLGLEPPPAAMYEEVFKYEKVVLDKVNSEDKH